MSAARLKTSPLQALIPGDAEELCYLIQVASY